MEAAGGTWFALARSTRILTAPGSAEAATVGEQLASVLRRSTGYPLPVSAGHPAARAGGISSSSRATTGSATRATSWR